ncbi:hypothetical protein BABINDRAFT_8910 [Babjeviella inositovora NRRL Y-12698]|uniref:RING-type domain-containing protein n=1 Tax=Babjeviella inositovora NRRL Y-12698 TaxID=984486 RepID=A0A1E3QLU9_9ASCO|nr:uncharacterized protein BABINDRAFT_8910 [Babjeviella inositovora NRRL Y-12698]ODQ78661.1 hypothetical protein BABINDRAFT_8910 [Babjeviella inositovora NRRL Y-12698]
MGAHTSKPAAETKVLTPNTPVNFTASFLAQLENSAETDYTRSQNAEQYIQERIAQELRGLEAKAQQQFEGQLTSALLTKDENNDASSSALSEKLSKLTEKLQEAKFSAVGPSKTVLSAKQSVIQCLQDNKGKPLNCWDEVESFKKLVAEFFLVCSLNFRLHSALMISARPNASATVVYPPEPIEIIPTEPDLLDYDHYGLIASREIPLCHPTFSEPSVMAVAIVTDRKDPTLIHLKTQNMLVASVRVDMALFHELSFIENQRKTRSPCTHVVSELRAEIRHGLSNMTAGNLTLSYRLYVASGLEVAFSESQTLLIRTVLGFPGLQKGRKRKLDIPEPELTPKYFYDIITDHTLATTASHAKLQIPNLYTDLFPFQTEAVLWLLSQEGMQYDSGQVSPTNLCLKTPEEIHHLLDKLVFGWGIVGDNWFNRFTGHVLPVSEASGYLDRYIHTNFVSTVPAKALLAEEMGLGKTVEIAALILLNPRAPRLINTTYKNHSDKTITRVKASLILLPEAILQQWVDEFHKITGDVKVYIYKGLAAARWQGTSINQIRERLAAEIAAADVVIVGYLTVASEFHYAQYSHKTRPPTRSCRKKEKSDADYSSPLTVLEFHRLIMDEAQMVSSTFTKLSQVTQMIPRYHSWAVSGTPVKTKIGDLFGVLRCLQVNPFGWVGGEKHWLEVQARVSLETKPRSQVKSEIEPNIYGASPNTEISPLFSRLWRGMSLRHTKQMVSSQISLPAQNRIMLTVPFTAVEQNNYDHVYEDCLNTIGFDSAGTAVYDSWGDNQTVLGHMRQYLGTLRQLCCHAEISGELDVSNLSTVDDVLRNMVEETELQLVGLEREIFTERVRLGQVKEVRQEYREGLEIWMGLVEPVKAVIGRAKAGEKREAEAESKPKSQVALEGDAEGKDGEKPLTKDELSADERTERLTRLNSRVRSFHDILHRLYFFIASAHFRLYNPPGEANKNDIPDEELSEADLHHRKLEVEYYQKAEMLRREMLGDSIQRVNEMIERAEAEARSWAKPGAKSGVKTLQAKSSGDSEYKGFNSPVGHEAGVTGTAKGFGLPRLTFPLNDALSVDSPTVAMFTLFEELNKQADFFNSGLAALRKLVHTRMEDLDDPDGEEYAASLDSQEQIYAYLEVLQSVLDARKLALVGGASASSESVAKSEMFRALKAGAQETKPAACDNPNLAYTVLLAKIKFSVREKNEASAVFRKVSKADAMAQVRELQNCLESEKKAIAGLQKVLGSCNAIYNAKIQYYKQLQEISDNVRAFDGETAEKAMEGQGEKERNLDDGVNPGGVSSQSSRDTPSGENTLLESLLAKLLDSERKLLQSIRANESLLARVSNRLKYLDTLCKPETKELDRLCVICRCEIRIGSIIQCGHKFCKECLDEWSQGHRTCPLCKAAFSGPDVYNFTYQSAAEVTVAREASHSSHLFQVYHEMDHESAAEIDGMTLADNFGSKVDLVVKNVLWLRAKDPRVQIVVFSQWLAFLRIIQHSLERNKVTSLTFKKDAATRFKRDPSVTCFLLNTRDQAAGLTLVNASHVFLCEPLVNTALELQAISRIHRIGQQRPTTVWMYVISESVEESIAVMATERRLHLLGRADESAVDSLQLADGTGEMVDAKGHGGEVVGDKDLWLAFFSNRS